MEVKGVDYSEARPGGRTIRDAGYAFVVRYLSYDSKKNVDAGELQDLHDNGLAVALVWESTAQRALDGRDGGSADAREASAMADALGFPTDRPVYFAVDWDATEGQQSQIDEYLRGAAEVLGAGRVGVYGGYWVVKRCFDNATVAYGWQTTSWSGVNRETRAHLLQDQNAQAVIGDCDEDVALKSDYGQWPAGGAPVDRDAARRGGGEGSMILLSGPDGASHRITIKDSGTKDSDGNRGGPVCWAAIAGGSGGFDGWGGGDGELSGDGGGGWIAAGTLAAELWYWNESQRWLLLVQGRGRDGATWQKVMHADGDHSMHEDWHHVKSPMICVPGR